MAELDAELVPLANGVRVVLDPMPGLATAAVGVWVRVGARFERAAENGIAHLFEHMAFKGAAGRSAKEFAEAVETIGASLNAATGYERTSYYGRCLAEYAPRTLDLVADIVLDPHWAPEDLELEKDVVAQERSEAFDQADDRVFDAHQSLVFRDQAMGRPILGEAETVGAVTVDDLRAFRAAHVTGARVVIAAAGAFDRAAILETAQRRFGGLAPGAGPAPEAARPGGGAVVEARRNEQANVVLSWDAPPAAHPDAFPARVLAEILGGGMSSRLFQEVREARGLVYAIDAWLDGYEDVGRLGVFAGCAAGNAATVAALVGDALESLARTGPGAAELARAKATLAANLLMGAEAPLARAEARTAQLFLRGNVLTFTSLRDRIFAVTADEVQAVAARAAASAGAAAVIGPKSGHGAAAAFAARFAG
ncbi:MAG: insulinase family protein [Alphaproteobacteria bacterium]|nr:insulinase family protein [Alphaproteobacteria bacterium]